MSLTIPRLWRGLAPLLLSLSASAADIAATGAGASAPAPLYEAWAEAYKVATGHTLSYQSVGSSAGIQKIKAGTVDFGASDVALKPEILAKDGLINFPTVISGVVPVVHLPNLAPGDLKLTGKLLADILSGVVKRWNAPEIAQANKGLRLPDLPITVVGRSDGSGTTYVLSHYLSKVSPDWKARLGNDFKLPWPAGTLAVNGSKEMVAGVQRINGAIGYVEYGYVTHNHLTPVRLQNHDGNFVSAEPSGFTEALAASGWVSRGSFEEMLTDMPGHKAWPVTGGTFVIVRKTQAAPARGSAVLGFFNWSLTNGDRIAAEHGFVAMPLRSQARAVKEMGKVTDSQGVPVGWSFAR